MTRPDLGALEAVAKGATEGNWKTSLEGYDQWIYTDADVPGGGDVICDWPESDGADDLESSRGRWPANALHIATFNPAAMLEILAYIRELEGALEPFAKLANEWEHGHWAEPSKVPDAETIPTKWVTLGSLRRARTALRTTGGEEVK